MLKQEVDNHESVSLQVASTKMYTYQGEELLSQSKGLPFQKSTLASRKQRVVYYILLRSQSA